MKKIISHTFFVGALCFASHTSWAETSSPTHSQSSVIDTTAPFGRLFTTPQERKTLNNKRRVYGFANPVSDRNNENEDKSTGSINSPQRNNSIKFSGILMRADGQQQVWINGKLANDQPGFKTTRTIEGDKQNSATIKIPLKTNRAILKPGQVWIPGSKKISESYLILLKTPKKEASPLTSEEASPVTPKEASPVTPEETSPLTPKEASPVAPEKTSPKPNTESTTTTQ